MGTWEFVTLFSLFLDMFDFFLILKCFETGKIKAMQEHDENI